MLPIVVLLTLALGGVTDGTEILPFDGAIYYDEAGFFVYGGATDGTEILPSVVFDEHNEVLAFILQINGVFHLAENVYSTPPPAGPVPGIRVEYGDHSATNLWRHTSTGLELITQTWMVIGEDMDSFMSRIDAHELDMIAQGYESQGDGFWLASDGSGGSCGMGFKTVGTSTQKISSCFYKEEDTDGDGKTDRVRYRSIETWRRSGESLEAFIARHDLFEDKMWDDGWTQRPPQ